MLGLNLNITSRTFSKTKRLRKRREFLSIQRRGLRSFGRFVVVIFRRAEQQSLGKLGITVPKKVGAAHVRNKIKRRIRHIFRLKQELFFEKNMVVIARSSSNSAAFSALEADITETCAKLKHERFRHSSHKK